MTASKLLKDHYPELFKDWDDVKNQGIDKYKISIGSSKKLINWKCHVCGFEWSQKVDRRILHKTACKICAGENKLLKNTHSKLYSELDTLKNQGIDLNLLTNRSSKKVWWLCEKGHSWHQSIDTRVKLGSKCRKCASSERSFILSNPELLNEWDPVKNKGLDPKFITGGSNKNIWWICSICGNSYQSKLYRRVNGSKCSNCRKRPTNKVPITKYFSHLLTEWDYDSNTIKPKSFSVSSNKKVWWECKLGHSWEAYIYNRTKVNGTTCPYCSGRTASPKTSLESLFPHLMKEWDYEKNKVVNPSLLRPGSHMKVWWVCQLEPNHKWESTIYSRTSKGHFGCPFCSGKYSLSEESLGATSQKLMKEWDWEKNKGVDPFCLSPLSEKKVWWRCKENSDHFWKTTVAHRYRGTKCPYCTFTAVLIKKYIKYNNLVKTDKINLYYIIIFNESEVFYKIGITKNSIEVRYKSLYEKTGYKLIKVKSIRGSIDNIISIEQTVHRKATRGLDVNLIKYRPKSYFGGISECYQLPNNLKGYEKKIKEQYKKYDPIITIKMI